MKRLDEKKRECPNLPLEIWQEIFSFLDIEQVYQCGRLCRSFDSDVLHKSVKILNVYSHTNNNNNNNILFDRLVNVQKIRDPYNRITSATLSSFRHLVDLEWGYENDIVLYGMTGLRSLLLHGSYGEVQSVPPGLSCLTNLERLHITGYSGVTDSVFSNLHKLASLSISGYSGITQNGLSSLSSLEYLHFHQNIWPDNGWLFPVSLRTVLLSEVTVGDSLYRLTNLTTLGSYCSDVDLSSLASSLTKLTTLSVTCHDNIGDEVLKYLTGLTTLDFSTPLCASNEGMAQMTNLRSLRLGSLCNSGHHMTSLFFSNLTNLTSLDVYNDFPLDHNDLLYLCNLVNYEPCEEK